LICSLLSLASRCEVAATQATMRCSYPECSNPNRNPESLILCSGRTTRGTSSSSAVGANQRECVNRVHEECAKFTVSTSTSIMSCALHLDRHCPAVGVHGWPVESINLGCNAATCVNHLSMSFNQQCEFVLRDGVRCIQRMHANCASPTEQLHTAKAYCKQHVACKESDQQPSAARSILGEDNTSVSNTLRLPTGMINKRINKEHSEYAHYARSFAY
jgi:hypothetical protein